MENYAILQITKFHSHRQMSAQQAHNDRDYEMHHVDAGKSMQNVYLVDRGVGYIDSWRKRYDEANILNDSQKKPRANAVLALELMMSFSRGCDVDIKQWSNENVKWLNRTFGEDNVLSCTLHMDEETPHIHATVIPIDKDNKLNAKQVIGGPSGMYKLQNSYGEAMKVCGLKRGEKRSKAKRQSIVKFYESVNQIDENPAPKQEEAETDKDYIRRLTDYCYKLKLAYENMKRKAERTKAVIDTRIAEAFREYKEGVNLYKVVLGNFKNDKEKAKGRMLDYIYLEENIPVDKLELLLSSIKDKISAPRIEEEKRCEEERKAESDKNK